MFNLNYNVIHCENSIVRYNNIKNMEIKLSKPINIFKAIIPQLKDQENIKIYDPNLTIVHKLSLPGQLGCYISHYLLIKSLIISEYDYTVIFEDDFEILIDELDDKIHSILNTIDIDFDILFLGTQNKEFGEKYKENIYYINKNIKTWGFQGYIINNKKINKILKYIKDITYEIDIQIFRHIKDNNLIGLFINPIYVSQNKKIKSTIRKTINKKLLLLYKQQNH